MHHNEPLNDNGDSVFLPARHAPFDVQFAGHFALTTTAPDVARGTALQAQLRPLCRVRLAPSTPPFPKDLAYFSDVAWVDERDTSQ